MINKRDIGTRILQAYKGDWSKLDGFLRTPPGYALIFWAINAELKATSSGGDVFYVNEKEWSNPSKPHKYPDEVPGDPLPVIDIHTHYIKQDAKNLDGQVDYHGMRDGCWWFCPPRFDFSTVGPVTPPKLKDNDSRYYGFEQYVRDFFFDSDTSFALISTGPYDKAPGLGTSKDGISQDFLTPDQMLKGKMDIDRLIGNDRAGYSGIITLKGETTPEKGAHAWKLYPENDMWHALDGNDCGKAFATLSNLTVDVPVRVCTHRMESPRPTDIPKAAIAFPKLTFIIYHSAGSTKDALLDNCNYLSRHLSVQNLYAETAAVFSELIMDDPRRAQTFLRTLLEPPETNSHKILWGTDSVWYGAPQWQVEAFRRIRLGIDDEAKIKKRILAENARRVFGLTRFGTRKAFKKAKRAYVAATRIANRNKIFVAWWKRQNNGQ